MNISRSCSVWTDSFHFDFPDTDKTISLRTSNKQKCVNVVFLLPSFMSPAVEFVSTVSTVKKQKTKCMDKHDVCFEIKFKSSLDKHDVCFEIKFKSSLDKHYFCFGIKFELSLNASKCFYSFWFLKHFWNFNYLFIFFAEKY